MPLPPLPLRHAAIIHAISTLSMLPLLLFRFLSPLFHAAAAARHYAIAAMPSLPCRHAAIRLPRFTLFCHTLSPPFTLIFRCFHYFRDMPLHAA
jgi:hypothetical protein